VSGVSHWTNFLFFYLWHTSHDLLIIMCWLKRKTYQIPNGPNKNISLFIICSQTSFIKLHGPCSCAECTKASIKTSNKHHTFHSQVNVSHHIHSSEVQYFILFGFVFWVKKRKLEDNGFNIWNCLRHRSFWFHGSWLVMRLIERGYIVRATVRDPAPILKLFSTFNP